jgi:hypothetical protein
MSEASIPVSGLPLLDASASQHASIPPRGFAAIAIAAVRIAASLPADFVC